ncbi:MAG: hypothetical protein IJX63_14690 [Lachnospiraceae bacterium]|nr:hypothetical protein [Lachnospiraceae bacterium]
MQRANSLILDKACLETARKQFCLDIGLSWEEYVANRQKSVFIQKSVYAPGTLDIASVGARNYAEKTSFFRAIICLGQLFICCDESIYDWVVEQYGQCKPEWFCTFGNLRKLEEKLCEHGHRIYDTHVYFLPEAVDKSTAWEDNGGQSDLLWYNQEEILRFKENNQFTSAISFWQEHPDVLAVAALKEEYKAEGKTFDQSHLAGMAGTSLDGEYLWQIGINVDKDCAGRGLAHKLVRILKEEVFSMGKVPFYGTSESHTVSQTVGLKAGFVPAWNEVSVERIPVNQSGKT